MAEKSIEEKIAKLFRKAESAEEIGSMEEAMIFVAKANELLTKYNLDKGDINLEEERDNIDYQEVVWSYRYKHSKVDGDWIIHMYNVVAKFHYCKVIAHPGSPRFNIPHSLTVFGEQQNIDMVIFVCTQLIETAKELVKKNWKEYHGPEKRNKFRRGYYIGFVAGIHEKLQEQRKQQEQDKPKQMGALIVMTDKLVNQKVEEKYPNIKKASNSRKTSSQHGSMAGFRDGKRTNIKKGIDG